MMKFLGPNLGPDFDFSVPQCLRGKITLPRKPKGSTQHSSLGTRYSVLGTTLSTPPPSRLENNFDSTAPSAHHSDRHTAAPKTMPAATSPMQSYRSPQNLRVQNLPRLSLSSERHSPHSPSRRSRSPPPTLRPHSTSPRSIALPDSGSAADNKNKLSRPTPAPRQTAPTTPEKTTRLRDPQTPPPPAPTRPSPERRPATVAPAKPSSP